MRSHILTSVLLVLAVCDLHAADRYVATTGVDAAACIDSGAPCRTVSFAIGIATAGDAIHVDAGLYPENPVIDRDLTILGAGATLTTIDGGGEPVALPTIVVAPGVTATLRDLALTDGYADGWDEGGGVTNRGDLTLERVRVVGNAAMNPRDGGDGYGAGGIFNAAGLLAISDVTVSGNLALETYFSHAGGVMNAGGRVTAVRTAIIDNELPAPGDVFCHGGGLANQEGGSVELTDTTIANNNYCQKGGGLYNDGTATLVRCHITTNYVGDTFGGDGGGIYNLGALVIEDSLIEDNGAAAGGGGISSSGTVTLSRTTLRGNGAEFGGGLFHRGAADLIDSTVSENQAINYRAKGVGGGVYSAGPLSMTNTTVSSNSADGDPLGFVTDCGGGLYVEDTLAELRFSTITGNHCTARAGARGAGGLYASDASGVRFEHTLVAGNTTVAGDGPDCVGPIRSFGYNLVGNSRGCLVFGDLTGVRLDVDPLLGSLAANGGPTETHALQLGSPAIDADPGCAPGSDQRGMPRPVDGDCDLTAACDIGAYERQTCRGPGVYEASDPAAIVLPANEIAADAVSPVEVTGGPADLLFYAVDDGAGYPGVIRMVRGGIGLGVHF